MNKLILIAFFVVLGCLMTEVYSSEKLKDVSRSKRYFYAGQHYAQLLKAFQEQEEKDEDGGEGEGEEEEGLEDNEEEEFNRQFYEVIYEWIVKTQDEVVRAETLLNECQNKLTQESNVNSKTKNKNQA